MHILDVKRFSERLLVNLSPQVPCAFEGVAFSEPDEGIYQKIRFLLKTPEDTTISKYHYREVIQLQVYVVGEQNKGSSEVIQRAIMIRNLFAKGSTFVEGSTVANVFNTPAIKGIAQAGDRLVCPVFVEFTVEVNT